MTKEEIMMKHCSDNGLLSMRLGKSILAAMDEYAEQQLKNCNLQSVIKSLPEYNEILYHAKTLTNEQFREYWDEVQGNVL